MANTPQDDRFYKPETLKKAFGISAALMLVFTIWMILDDFGREWKGYQLEFFNLRTKKYNEWIEKAKENSDQPKIAELSKSVEAAQADLNSKKDVKNKLDRELVQLKTKEKLAVVKFQNKKAVWDVLKYQYEAKYGHYIAEKHLDPKDPKAVKALASLNGELAKVEELRNTANGISQQVEAKEREIAEFSATRDKAEKELKVARAELDRLNSGKTSTELTFQKLVRNAPILDMASPVLKLNQIVLPDIRNDIYFAQVKTIDRCTSCHLAIDTPGFENEKQPFRTHPKLDVMLGSRSPHPIDKIGCTPCHSGRGEASDFVRSAHTPRNEEQKKEWEKKYGWHEMHHVIEKMVPLQYTAGKCRTCHQQTEYVPKADKLNKSIQLVQGAGCYGCHRIEGWDHLRKPAPSLMKVKGKLTRDWMVKWVRNPQSFNEFARMPASFHQSNITTEEFHQYQDAEIHAAVDYLLSVSDTYEPNVKLGLGDVENGKKLFESVGCRGCHQINDFPRTQGRFGRAPDLSTVGSKVSKEWLVSWLKNPRHYWEETTMPSLRLTDKETSDLAAYLMSKKNADFDKMEAGVPDLEAQKKVLRLYLRRDPKLAPVTEARIDDYIRKMKPEEIPVQLGKSTITRMGCFGCHMIKGFETTAGIGTELTEEGTKPVNKLDFGLMHLPHTNVAWFHQKFLNTRSFDAGIAKEYLDLLRMPNYGFTDKERDELVLFILGLTSQKVGPPAAKVLNAREAKVEEGLRIIHKYNCQGCHVVENLFQPLPDDHPGKEEHDKMRFDLEGRVLANYTEDETLGPPNLFGEGKKVRTDWAHAFLHAPYTLRPSLKIRMPTFQMSNDEVNKIVSYFAHDGSVEYPISPAQRVSLTPKEVADGQALLNRLQCLNCHTLGEKLSPAQLEGTSKGLAPSFIESHKRLRRDWIVEWLKDPQKLMPGTRMPGFWPEGASPAPDILGGDGQKQMELLAKYLIYLGQDKR